jgi:hypothetical protein
VPTFASSHWGGLIARTEFTEVLGGGGERASS